ncbi:MAG: hypothetical protein Tsb0010_12690 [Parvularculaceae bacterium]
MPKLFGLNSVGVLAASVAFFFVGFLWYGVLFQDVWMAAHGITEEDASGPVWMLGGFVITVIQVIGLGLVLRWRGAADPMEAAKTGALVWLVFALPIAHYDYLYTPAHDWMLLLVNSTHLLVGWVVSAVILSVLK